jgi:20S proteasome subunit beta 7
MNPKQWHTALQAYLYGRRNEGNPLWTANVIAGVDQHTKSIFLGVVDKLGNAWEAATVATGYGAYLAQPLLRSATQEGAILLSEEQAVALLEQCMRVLYLRDARASNKVQLAKVAVSEQGKVQLQISKPYLLETDWSIA